MTTMIFESSQIDLLRGGMNRYLGEYTLNKTCLVTLMAGREATCAVHRPSFRSVAWISLFTR